MVYSGTKVKYFPHIIEAVVEKRSLILSVLMGITRNVI